MGCTGGEVAVVSETESADDVHQPIRCEIVQEEDEAHGLMFKLQRYHSRQSYSLVVGRKCSRAYMQRGGNQFGDDRLGVLALLRQNQRTPEVR
jgi:hypothetical protein